MSNAVLDVITKRSSARSYSDVKLTEEELNIIIDAGLKAPTGMNLQELTFSVLDGDNPIIEELDTEKRALRNQEKLPQLFHYGAPCLIIISADEKEKWAQVDAGIAVQNMALAAESIGLGNLIIGCIYDAMHGDKMNYFNEKLSIPEGKSFQIALAVGHKLDSKTPHIFEKDKQVVFVK